MTMQATHHPSDEHLKIYAAGTMATGISVAVSAHMDFCTECTEKTRQLEAELAGEWAASEEMTSNINQRQLNDLLDSIASQPQVLSLNKAEESDRESTQLHMHERSVRLPRVLAKAASSGVAWKRLAGGINTANLGMDTEAQCDFIYMKPGSQAPQHKHQGTEVTLVLEGTFHDELGDYKPGDFVYRQGSETHTPQSDEGCLCYSVLDSPLIFTTGLSRLLNPFQRFMFNRQMRFRTY